TVSQPTTLLSVSPDRGIEGPVNLPITITGQNTHFTNSSTIDLGTGIVATNVAAPDATHLTAQVTIGNNATAEAARNLVVTSGNEVLALTMPFTARLMPSILSLNPATGVQGQVNLTIGITGQNTHFNDSSTIDLGPGITLSNVFTHLPSQLTA